MTISCIMCLGPHHIKWLLDAYLSAANLYDEMILVIHADAMKELFESGYSTWGKTIQTVVDGQDGLRIGHAKNLGISIARGDWICTLDVDDLVVSDGQRLVRELAEANEGDVIAGMVQEFGDLAIPHVWPTNPSICSLEKENCVPVSAWFKKSLWWEVGGFSNVRYEDWHFWIKCKQAGARFRFTPSVFYRHRRWPGSVGAQVGYNSQMGFQPL